MDFRTHAPEVSRQDAPAPLASQLQYDRSELSVDQTVTARAIVRSSSPKALPMVVLDLPIPAGFSVEPDSLQRLRDNAQIAKIQTTPRSILVYLRSLSVGELPLSYTLRSTLPVKTTTAPAIAYEYYSPEIRSESEARHLVVLNSK